MGIVRMFVKKFYDLPVRFGRVDSYTQIGTDGVLTYAGLKDPAGTALTSTAAELNILDGVTSTAAELNILDGVTSTAAELNILDGVTATAAELNQQCDLQLQYMLPGSGFSGGGGGVRSSARATGGLVKTEIVVDLTGASSIATDLDIIGTHVSDPAHIGRLTSPLNGATFWLGKMTCHEVPVGGAVDIDLYCATEPDGYLDEGIAGHTGVALVTSDGNWTIGRELVFIAMPVNGQYLYLVSGAATAGEYSAGRFLIEIWGF